MRFRIATIGVLLAVLFLTSSVYAGATYFGVEEVDKGEGIWALVASYHVVPTTEFWAGVTAEFIRRHPDRQIIASFSVARYGYDLNNTDGVVFITLPKR